MYLASCAVPQVALADCAHEIIDQAYKGSVTRHYSQACYTAAIRIEPVDGSSYSDIDAIIKDAKRADALRVTASAAGPGAPSARRRRDTRPPEVSTSRPATPPATLAATQRAPSHSPPATLAVGGRNHPAAADSLPASSPPAKASATLLAAPTATPVLEHLAPAHAGDVPVAVIVLGVLATLLVLAGLAGAIARRRNRRRA